MEAISPNIPTVQVTFVFDEKLQTLTNQFFNFHSIKATSTCLPKEKPWVFFPFKGNEVYISLIKSKKVSSPFFQFTASKNSTFIISGTLEKLTCTLIKG